MLDENEFLSPYGIRSLSRYHAEHPVRLPRRRPGVPRVATCRPSPTPACSAATRTGAGPIWMPVNGLIIRALLQYYTLLRRRLHGRVPDRLGPADEPVPRSPRRSRRRLASIFLRDADGRRPVYGGAREVPGRPALARPASCSTSTSTATTAPASAPATRPAGPASSPASCTCSRRRTPSRCSRPARQATSSETAATAVEAGRLPST